MIESDDDDDDAEYENLRVEAGKNALQQEFARWVSHDRNVVRRNENDTDALRAWHEGKLRDSFPMLAHVAQVVLPVTAAEIPCERLFSSSGRTMTFDRVSLANDTMRALVMWKQNGRTLELI